ncbi:MAG: hypothetical protein K6A67_01970 [Bacteroidales bacterium]|nr:hypothetical protein [Bacteroidales bacterium]
MKTLSMTIRKIITATVMMITFIGSANAQLLYEGPWAYDNQSFGISTMVIYEDYLETDGIIGRHNYVGTNDRGERVYKGETVGLPSTIYVSSSLKMRVVEDVFGMISTKTIRVRGNSFLNESNNSQGGNNGTSNNRNANRTNPVQPHKVTKDCHLCQGSGKCNTCNGKHWYYGIGGTKITCPNCTPNGACSSCGGSGKKTTTEYR